MIQLCSFDPHAVSVVPHLRGDPTATAAQFKDFLSRHPKFKQLEGDGESWLTAAIPMDNPRCSSKLTRVRPVAKHQPLFDEINSR